jgi:hypothetical protein
MVRNFKKNTARFIALAIAVFMVLSLLPISELVFAETDNFFVKVVDGDFGTPISNAMVTLIPEDGTNIDELPPVVTDTDGIAEFSKISEYFDGNISLSIPKYRTQTPFKELKKRCILKFSAILYTHLQLPFQTIHTAVSGTRCRIR